MTVPAEPVWADSGRYYEGATRVIHAPAICTVIAASYAIAVVDEYQDCTQRQHALAVAMGSAHVLLHDRGRFTIVEGADGADNSMDREADDFAGRVLLPRALDARLATIRSWAQAVALANEAGVHLGIIVGRLKHDKVIPTYSNLNGLRTHLAFAEK